MTVGFFLFMVLKIPKLVQGLLSGSPQMGASDAMGMARQGAAVAAGAVSGGLSVVGAVRGAYAAQGAGGSGDDGGGGGGGGGSRMSSISNIGGGSDATGMGAVSGLSGGGGGGATAMAASMGGGSGGGSSSGASSGGGGSIPSSGGGPSIDSPISSGAAGSSGNRSKARRFGEALWTAGKNAAIGAVYNSKPAQAYRNAYSLGQNGYRAQTPGAVSKSWETGEELDANGKSVPSPTLAMNEKMDNLQSALNEISSKLTPPPAPPTDLGTFDPKQ